MIISDYELLHADLSNEAGRQLTRMARSGSKIERKRVAWISERLEEFIVADTGASHRVEPQLRGGHCEVYAVPPPSDLEKPPGVIALVRVDHRARTIELIAIVVEHPRMEEPVWEQITEIARAAVLGC